MPKISVIVPVYKVEPYLHRCVDSILAQTFMDFELILVDDGSPDNCGKICDEYAEHDARVHVIHQENGGLSAARNAGIDWAFANSDSEWLSFVDSDDWVKKECLEVLFYAIRETSATISIGMYQKVKEGDSIIEEEIVKEPELSVCSFEGFLCTKNEGINPVIATCRLYLKTLFSNVRFPKGKIHEDLFVIPQLQHRSNHLVVVKQVLYYYYQSDISITRREWDQRRLDEITASEKLIRYLKSNNLNNAREWAIKRYVWVLQTQINEIEQSIHRDDAAIKLIMRKLQSTLISQRKVFPIKDHPENRVKYEIAFPKAAWLYWTIRGIANKFRRLIKHDAAN